MYLNVHEPYLDAFDLGYVCSDEPGYYKDGEYGIRIEDQVTVIDAELFFDEPYYKIDMMTMVPYEPKLIDIDIMTDEQLAVLNERNAQTRATVGALMLESGYTDEYEWLMSKTEPLTKTLKTTGGGAASIVPSVLVVFAAIAARLASLME
ncbi:Peptidase M24 C-terminal domain [Trinorchestia longiramus]|nr:Peptidase M24 C-terminal domain [Trinorchestia longiramus]